jgi:flavorubredoxin
MSRIERIADDIVVLSDLVPVDGRVSWIAPGARGFEPYNEYVVLAGDRALLIDTGVAVHEASIIESLRDVVGSRRLTVWISRIELDCIGNLAAVLEAFPGAQVATANVINPVTLVHLAEGTPAPRPTHMRFGVSLEEIGFPGVQVLDPVIKTLGTSWLWHAESETLFSTDSFCTDLMRNADDAVVRREADPSSDPARIHEAVLCKFDWLMRVKSDLLLRRWDHLFTNVRPSALAPIHGRIQLGRSLVERVIDDYRAGIFLEHLEAAK